jgi:hypothetical protein
LLPRMTSRLAAARPPSDVCQRRELACARAVLYGLQRAANRSDHTGAAPHWRAGYIRGSIFLGLQNWCGAEHTRSRMPVRDNLGRQTGQRTRHVDVALRTDGSTLLERNYASGGCVEVRVDCRTAGPSGAIPRNSSIVAIEGVCVATVATTMQIRWPASRAFSPRQKSSPGARGQHRPTVHCRR